MKKNKDMKKTHTHRSLQTIISKGLAEAIVTYKGESYKVRSLKKSPANRNWPVSSVSGWAFLAEKDSDAFVIAAEKVTYIGLWNSIELTPDRDAAVLDNPLLALLNLTANTESNLALDNK